MVLAADDPWWQDHSPSNGYGCKCKKFPVSERQLRRMDKSGPDVAPPVEYKEFVDKRSGEVRQIPVGVDPGFDHTPGQSWLRSLSPEFTTTQAKPIPMGRLGEDLPLPVPTPVSQELLLEDNLPDEQYVSAFLDEFGDAGKSVFTDVMGEPMAINDYLFRGVDGAYKISKDKIRHRYLRLLARSIINPDEIWTILEPDTQRPGKYRIKRRYLKRWSLEENGQIVHGFSAFEYGNQVWTGNTVFTPHRKRGGQRVPENDSYLEKQREGVLVYRRKAEG